MLLVKLEHQLIGSSHRPNIIMGANAQVALEKFARYFEVECRLVPISIESKYRLDPKKAMEYVDENTIGIFIILGSTCSSSISRHYMANRDLQVHILDIMNL